MGTRDSAEVLTKMEYTWYREGEAHLAAQFASRAILPYLLVGNVRGANTAYRNFTSFLSTDNEGLNVQSVSSATADVRVFPGLPLLNFLGLLLLAVQRGAPEVYKGLISRYASQINEVGDAWSDPLETIGEMYFGIARPRQSNPLMDMMNGFFGGGGAAQQPKRPALRVSDGPAPAGLD
jgi:golgi to ER traffic protein 4